MMVSFLSLGGDFASIALIGLHSFEGFDLCCNVSTNYLKVSTVVSDVRSLF